MPDYRNNMVMQRCPICGKKFLVAPLHIYKSSKTHKKYCGWNCYRKAQREHPEDFIQNKRNANRWS